MKTNTLSLIYVHLLTGLALLQSAQAVFPPPDGGYPGFNTAEGQNALLNLTTGQANTAVGWSSLRNDTTGNNNTAMGAGALLSNNTGDRNTAIGVAALLSNHGGLLSFGSFNTAIGTIALVDNSTGFGNTAVGDSALSDNTSGNNNTALGFGAGNAVTTASNVIAIGTEGANVDDSCYIGNIRNATVNASGVPVVIDLNNKVGTIVSSRRFKRDIQPMDKASEAILSLKPVRFHYASDTTNTPCFGLIAEQVAQVDPDLIARDKNGKIYTVRYDAVNAMLLNEFLKEHKKVEEQQATIAELKSTVAQQQKGFESKLAQQQKQIEALTVDLQRVSAQIELNKLAPQMVKNTD